MSIPQCFTVKDAIKLLKKSQKPDDKIIIDWLCAEDIRQEITDYGENDKIVPDEQAYKIMGFLDDTFDFSLGNVYTNENALSYMLPEIEEETKEVLA